MAGDYSRSSFSALKDFVGVLLQQGHPVTDADWDEFVAVVERRIRAGTVDTIGRAVVPRETPLGFEIRTGPGPSLLIGRGRMYVDGLLAENHGRIDAANPPVFDRARLDGGRAVGVLDEPISPAAGDFLAYDAQPYLPGAPPLPDGAGPHLVYLEVWRREVTPLKDPDLLDPALGGLDTATRWQAVWQVRVLPSLDDAASCATPDGEIEGWQALTAPSAARLTTATIEYEDPDEPCLIPPGGGYRGLENQLYRVEIHSGTTLADARFKWSRENASVGAAIDAFPAADRIRVRRIGRDDVLRFRTGDWVEVTDDRREFAGQAGDLRRAIVDEDSNELRFDDPLSLDLVPTGVGEDTAAARHSRVLRWDQAGQVRLADGSAWEDLDDDPSLGTIPVPPGGQAVVLEAGITVRFAEATAGGPVRPGDHWVFAARTATAAIEVLTDAPPAGEHHHFARLAMVRFPATVEDCRVFWPPEAGTGGDCACTVCVAPEEHNTGQRTIQSAIAELPPGGGTVCLRSGSYVLAASPVVLSGISGVRLRGHGVGTVLTYAGAGGAIRVERGRDVVIDGLAVLAAAPAAGAAMTAAIHLQNCQDVEVTGVTALVAGVGDGQGIGVALRGVALDVTVADCLLIAPSAVAADTAAAEGAAPGYLALAALRVADNLLLGTRHGIRLDGPVLHLGATEVTGNLIFAGEAGISATGAGVPVPAAPGPTGAAPPPIWSAAPLAVHANWIAVTAPEGSGVVSGVPNLRLDANTILGRNAAVEGEAGALIRLVEGLLPVPRPDCRVIGNRLGGCRGPAILVDAPLHALTVQENAIRDCGGPGLASAGRAILETLVFVGNLVERVAGVSVAGTAGGVVASAVLDGRICGNRIEGVGAPGAAATLWAGIAIRGAGTLDISGNSLLGIGAAAIGPQLRVGIWVDPPFTMANIAHNRVVGEVGVAPPGAGFGPFMAIGVFEGSTPGAVTNVAPVPSQLPVLLPLGNAAFVAGLGLAIALPPLTEAQLGIGGNLVHSANPGFAPLVLVAMGEGTGACVFQGNQVRLAAAGAMPALVIASAPRIVAANNVVRRESDADAMQLAAGNFGERPMATVVGNLTFGNIRLDGGALPAAFAPLNVLAP
jgi:hypothetical protein